MSIDRTVSAWRTRLVVFGATALWLTVSVGAIAQDRPPPGGPGAATPGSGGAPAGGPNNGPPRRPMTPTEELVASIPPPAVFPDRETPPPLGAEAPMPSADPRDLAGAWIRDKALGRSLSRIQTDAYGDPVPFTMAGAKILQQRVLANLEGKPVSNASSICRPPGVQWQHDMAFPFSIFQTRNYVEFAFSEYHGRWYIQLDPAFAPPPAEKQHMGYSLGHWDGDTLVVETTGQKEDVWIDFDGTPLSRDSKLVTRIRKVDHGDRKPYLEMTTTITDPVFYTQPWTVIRKFRWNPASLTEYNCEEQIGDPSAQSEAGPER